MTSSWLRWTNGQWCFTTNTLEVVSISQSIERVSLSVKRFILPSYLAGCRNACYNRKLSEPCQYQNCSFDMFWDVMMICLTRSIGNNFIANRHNGNSWSVACCFFFCTRSSRATCKLYLPYTSHYRLFGFGLHFGIMVIRCIAII